MNDDSREFPKGAEGRSGDRPGDPESPLSSGGPALSSDDGDWLDTEHHGRVTRVSGCDSARTRKHAAEAEIARLEDEEQVLWAELKALGDKEHVDAIMRSGWFPYAREIFASARLAMILDAVLWAALWLGVWALLVRTFRHG